MRQFLVLLSLSVLSSACQGGCGDNVPLGSPTEPDGEQPCMEDEECDGEQVCQDGDCVTVDEPDEVECDEQTACDEGFSCVSGECRERYVEQPKPECTDEDPCDEGFECIRGLCIETPDPVRVGCTSAADCDRGALCNRTTGICYFPEPDPDVPPPCEGEVSCPCYDNGSCNPRALCVEVDDDTDVCVSDADEDGVVDEDDNCPHTSNGPADQSNQVDLDQDETGDVCDNDVDGDGVPNDTDSCVRIYNPDNNNDPAPCLPPRDCNQSDQCNDGNACTADVCTVDGRCENTPINCDDGVDCTEDSCIPALGCQHGEVDDWCDEDLSCFSFPEEFEEFLDVDSGCHECVPGFFGNSEHCDDGDLCTIDSCTDDLTCEFEPRCGDDYECLVFGDEPEDEDEDERFAVCAIDRDGDGFFYGRGMPEDQRDCNDWNEDSNPEAPELCDRHDNDCDDDVDEGFEFGFCEVGVGACRRGGQLICSADKRGTECSVRPWDPEPEICGNDVDDDCDGATDENCGGGPGPNGGTDTVRICVPSNPGGTWSSNIMGDPAGGLENQAAGTCREEATLERNRDSLKFNVQQPNGGIYCCGWVGNEGNMPEEGLCPGLRAYVDGQQRNISCRLEDGQRNFRIE